MTPISLIVCLALFSTIAFWVGRKRSIVVANGRVRDLHSLPAYYGYYAAIWCGIPAFIIWCLWLSLETLLIPGLVVSGLPEELRSVSPDHLSLIVNDIKNLVSGNIVSGEIDATIRSAADHYQHLLNISHASLAVAVLALAMAGALFAWRTIQLKKRARNLVEAVIKFFLISSSTIAIFTTIGIVLSVLFESMRFFESIPFSDFLFGLEWSPQMAIRADQVGSSGAFGAIPLFAGTMLISFIAMLVAVPVRRFHRYRGRFSCMFQ